MKKIRPGAERRFTTHIQARGQRGTPRTQLRLRPSRLATRVDGQMTAALNQGWRSIGSKENRGTDDKRHHFTLFTVILDLKLPMLGMLSLSESLAQR